MESQKTVGGELMVLHMGTGKPKRTRARATATQPMGLADIEVLTLLREIRDDVRTLRSIAESLRKTGDR